MRLTLLTAFLRSFLATPMACLILLVMAPAPQAAAETVGHANSYSLGPGDKIKVVVYDEDELSGEYVVSPAGSISLPLAGDILVGGLSVASAQDNIKHALQPKYLKDARVSIELLSLRPFFILGEVEKPGQYPYSAGLTVLDAVATAGGFTYRANTHKLLIKHANETQERAYPLDPSTSVSAGDTIRIQERHF